MTYNLAEVWIRVHYLSIVANLGMKGQHPDYVMHEVTHNRHGCW